MGAKPGICTSMTPHKQLLLPPLYHKHFLFQLPCSSCSKNNTKPRRHFPENNIKPSLPHPASFQYLSVPFFFGSSAQISRTDR